MAGCYAKPWKSHICKRLLVYMATKFLEKLGELLDLDPEPFIEKEKHTTINRVGSMAFGYTGFFGTASFGIAATETYTRGVRNFQKTSLNAL